MVNGGVQVSGGHPYYKREEWGREYATGAFARRKLNIPDALIEDFLENDIEKTAKIMHRSMIPNIEIAKKFGTVDMTKQIEDIRADYARKLEAAKDEKTRIKLHKQRDNDIRDIAAMRDRIRGVYALPQNPNSLLTRTLRGLRYLNYIRLLGGMTLTAVSDIGKPIMVHGMGNVYGKAILPLIKTYFT